VLAAALPTTPAGPLAEVEALLGEGLRFVQCLTDAEVLKLAFVPLSAPDAFAELTRRLSATLGALDWPLSPDWLEWRCYAESGLLGAAVAELGGMAAVARDPDLLDPLLARLAADAKAVARHQRALGGRVLLPPRGAGARVAPLGGGGARGGGGGGGGGYDDWKGRVAREVYEQGRDMAAVTLALRQSWARGPGAGPREHASARGAVPGDASPSRGGVLIDLDAQPGRHRGFRGESLPGDSLPGESLPAARARPWDARQRLAGESDRDRPTMDGYAGVASALSGPRGGAGRDGARGGPGRLLGPCGSGGVARPPAGGSGTGLLALPPARGARGGPGQPGRGRPGGGAPPPGAFSSGGADPPDIAHGQRSTPGDGDSAPHAASLHPPASEAPRTVALFSDPGATRPR